RAESDAESSAVCVNVRRIRARRVRASRPGAARCERVLVVGIRRPEEVETTRSLRRAIAARYHLGVLPFTRGANVHMAPAADAGIEAALTRRARGGVRIVRAIGGQPFVAAARRNAR